ncbi:MAG TPA: glycosyltransferase [Sulfurimonas autotrophica]|nr:glycosyltransferase [Sulfurimonas autotrophica]
MSVYYKESANFLKEALLSIENQTLPMDEIVLVKDGPLTSELDRVIRYHSEHSKIPYKIIKLKENIGLGKALNKGMKHCSYEWIARMDSDDIAFPKRFEKQFAMLVENPDIDILGSWICEFDDDPVMCSKERKVPALHRDIVKFAKYRNPLNHMTVVFRKDAVLDVSGYLPMNGFEDYYLWMRMLMKGKRFANLPQVLVKARTGRGMIVRRQGWKYAKDELALEKAAYQMGFWSMTDLAKNFFTRFLPRLLPVFIVEKLYNLLRKF